MFSRSITALLVTLCLAGPVSAAAEFTMPVDDTFGGGTLTVNGYGRGYVYRWDAFRHEGQIAICGAGYFPDVSSAVGIRRLLRKAVVEVNGKQVLRDISFFTQVRSEAALEAARANCTNTGIPAPKSDNVDVYIVWPSGGIRF